MKIHNPPRYHGERPTDTRKIPIKYASYRGQVRTTKLHLLSKRPPLAYDYESELEKEAYILLDHDLYCVEIIPQPLIVWTDEKGKDHKYHADVWAAFYDPLTRKWKIIVFEIKPKRALEDLEQTEDEHQKIIASKKYCAERGWEFRIITEEHINTVRLANIKIFHHFAIIPPEKILVKSVRDIIAKIYKKNNMYTFFDLRTRVHKELKKETPEITIQKVENVLFYLLYYQELFFDWEELFNTEYTMICCNFNFKYLLEPFHLVEPVEQAITTEKIEVISSEFDLASDKEKQKGKARYFAIEPLLKIEQEQRLSKADVIKQAKSSINYEYKDEKTGEKRGGVLKSSTRSLYKWLRIYKETRDWKSLVSRNYKKGNRQARFPSEVEEIIQTAIKNRPKMGSDTACWLEVKRKIEMLNEKGAAYPVPSLKAVRARIDRIPAKERLGKQGGYIRDEIPRSVQGSLSARIEHPLHLVQMDHTQLDIFLVDVFDTKVKPKGQEKPRRPWLTMGVDGRTRMIWTWYLSFETPNSVTVAKAIVRGFLPKNKGLKELGIDIESAEQGSNLYPIYGVPRTIQYDNAKEFDSKHVKEFCRCHGVEDAQFRPGKRPDTGAFVERMFKTINESWLVQLPGYAPPIKNRPEGIEPEKEARLTFLEFEEWLVNQIVIYHHEPHGGLEEAHGVKRRPIEQFYLDMNGRMPPIPANPELLKFEIFPFDERVLNATGISWGKTAYNNKMLTEIRRRNRGQKKKIRFRYDVEDVTSIWAYDEDKACYINVRASGGLLARFVRENPGVPVRLSEYAAVKKQLREEKNAETSANVRELLLKNEKIAEEARKRCRSKKKKESPAPRKAKAGDHPHESKKGMEIKQKDETGPKTRKIKPSTTEWEEAVKHLEFSKIYYKKPKRKQEGK